MRSGEGGGAAVAGASLVSAPVSHSPTSDRPGLRSGAACPSPGAALPPPPPPSARGEPVSPRTVCAPPSGPWMGKCSRRGGRAGLRFAPLPLGSRPDVPRPGSPRAGRGAGGQRSGPGGARRCGFRVTPRGARIAEGRSPTRRPHNIRSLTLSHREVEESPVQPLRDGGRLRRPESGEPGPASLHFLSENGARRWGRRRRRSGRASFGLGSCCLPG